MEENSQSQLLDLSKSDSAPSTSESSASVENIIIGDSLNAPHVHLESEGSERTGFNIKLDVGGGNDKFLLFDHPLLIKYQNDLKERLLKLNQETDDQLIDLKRTIEAQEKENQLFAERGYDLQKDLKQLDEKLEAIHVKYEEQVERKETNHEKCTDIKNNYQAIEENRKSEVKKDLELQKAVEQLAFEVVQLTSLQMESFTDAKSLQRTVEKSTKDKELLEIQKLRQDLLISQIENNRFNLEDKINFYRTQWGIKREEASELRKELNSANVEMETIHFEKQQIVHQWKQSLAALEKQDRVLAEIRESARHFEEDSRTLNMDIIAYKKLLRKELERNEQLVLQLQFRESDIGNVQRDLNEIVERENDLAENVSVLDQTVEISEQELKILLDSKSVKEKDLEAKEKELQKIYASQTNLEKKHMDMLHEKMTITKASKYTEKLIKDTRNFIHLNEEKGAKKENEREKLLLKLDNLRTYISNMENKLEELLQERKERALLLDKSEESALKSQEKIDVKRGEIRELDNKLKEMISEAGGQELGPYERELANLRKEITIAEQGKRNLEEEYLRCQQQLFVLNKQSSIKSEENEFYSKKIAILEGKKIQLEADIIKEEKDIKEAMIRIESIGHEIVHINSLLKERKDLQESLLQTSELSKFDFIKTLKDAEFRYVDKQNELRILRRKKKKRFRKLLKTQQCIVYWEGRIHLADETRKILKSDEHLSEFYLLKSEIRRLQVKEEQIKKEQEKLILEMRRAVYTYTNLYIEADKQSVFGKRKITPDYVKKRIKYTLKKVQEEKKVLEKYFQEIESLKMTQSITKQELDSLLLLTTDLMNKIKSLQYDMHNKEQERRLAVINLSFKQKESKFMQKVLDGSYVRAMRNEMHRLEEIGKLQDGLRAMQVISHAVINEYPELEKTFRKITDYITASKRI
ncbi:coiled-coil domain-containing protein 40 [Parasteatoda tepidariorum]|uniref:coiled-coil domain-containing protein 40 n=1 Tax=Parasteatoda tepidariorum TaxID=114398 RepID=UPI00077FA0C5|nr:coiled-coil domain-containing protein 40 [Parasteatoda tepidariorum]